MTENPPKPKPDPTALLRLSEHFLRRRKFTDSRSYAQQAYNLNPNLPNLTKILTVANVLQHQTSKETLTNWYHVLQLNLFSQDSGLVKKQFDHLYDVLKPDNNINNNNNIKIPFLDEAFCVACDAWDVLSDSEKKAEFDINLKKYLNDNNGLNDDNGLNGGNGLNDDHGLNGDGLKMGCDDMVFWTVCPYCYYLFEFERVYLEVCVRCPNEKCCKAFTCVEIGRPPVEVLEVGEYLCSGFVMLGLGKGCWNPFAPLSNELKKRKVDRSGDSDRYVEISDDDEDEVEIKMDGCFDVVGGEGVDGGVKKEDEMVIVKPSVVRRKKSVAKSTKKVTGVGNKVRKLGVVYPETTDGCVFF